LNHLDADVIATRAYAIDISDQAYGLYREQDIPAEPAGWLKNGLITHPTVMARTSWFHSHPYDESLRKTQDKELWIRASQDTIFAKLPERLLYYRVRGNVTLGAYRMNCRYDRIVTRLRGPSAASRPAVVKALASSYLKELLAAAAYTAGAPDKFQARRVTQLDARDVMHASAGLAAVRATPVPGWIEP
jgi:hypothetical protein